VQNANFQISKFPESGILHFGYFGCIQRHLNEAEAHRRLEVIESIASHRDLSDLFHDLAQLLRNILQFDHLSVRLHDLERIVMRSRRKRL
jgi:hypothetical protein